MSLLIDVIPTCEPTVTSTTSRQPLASVILTMTTCCRARKKSTQKETKRSISALSRRSSRPISSKKPSLIPSFMAKKGLQGTQLSSTSRPAPAKKWSITYSIVLKSCEFQSQFSSSTTLTKNTKTSSTTRTHRCLSRIKTVRRSREGRTTTQAFLSITPRKWWASTLTRWRCKTTGR